MQFIYSSRCLEHRTGAHPECAERLAAFADIQERTLPSGFDYLPLVHTPDHIARVQQACSMEAPLDNDTQTSSGSYLAALAAVAASITAAEEEGFALVRPPGHHAYPHKSTGFCLFNNIAIATAHLCKEEKKILILDIDGHLGDGTSYIFRENAQVLFCSLHQYPAFPGQGWIDEIGQGAGTGYTINIPMPPGAGDDLFWEGMQLIQSIAKQFQPHMVAVSAGFDGHQLDPLLQLRYSLNTYFQCGRWLKEHFGKAFAVLEGGYNLEILPKAIWNFADGYNGQPCQFHEPSTSSPPALIDKFSADLDALRHLLTPYWKV